MAVSEQPQAFTTRASAAARSYKSLGRGALIAVVLAGLVMNGAVAAPFEAFLSLATAIVVALFLPVRLHTRLTRRTIAVAAPVILAGALWIVLQALPVLPAAWAHPIWAETAGLLPEARPHVSVAPAHGLSALPQFALPPLVFLTVLALCQGKRAAGRMWIALSLAGLAVVALSTALELGFPRLRFFSTQPVAFGTFSGVFVNRNIAASVFVLTAFGLAGTVYLLRADARGRHSYRDRADDGAWSFGSLFCVFGLFATMVAVIATQSRAGTFIGLPILFIALAICQALTAPAEETGPSDRRRALLQAAAVVAAGGMFLLLFAEPVLLRFETYGLADPRWCAWQGTLAAIRDHPWTGTGFGAFVDTFPAYRDPECGWLDATWVRAHNGFLELALGLGVPAAILIVGFGYAVVIGPCLHGLRHRRSLRPIPVLTLGILAFLTAHSMVDFPMQIPGVALYAAALTGAGCALCMLERAPPARPGARQGRPRRPKATSLGASSG